MGRPDRRDRLLSSASDTGLLVCSPSRPEFLADAAEDGISRGFVRILVAGHGSDVSLASSAIPITAAARVANRHGPRPHRFRILDFLASET